MISDFCPFRLHLINFCYFQSLSLKQGAWEVSRVFLVPVHTERLKRLDSDVPVMEATVEPLTQKRAFCLGPPLPIHPSSQPVELCHAHLGRVFSPHCIPAANQIVSGMPSQTRPQVGFVNSPSVSQSKRAASQYYGSCWGRK